MFLLYKTTYNIMHFSSNIQQPVRSIKYSKGSPNLMNTNINVLEDNIEYKTETLVVS